MDEPTKARLHQQFQALLEFYANDDLSADELVEALLDEVEAWCFDADQS
jgi:hypothetical protein